MEFPELLSVLLYEDCSKQVEAEFAQLKTLAYANGSNPALALFLGYFNKVKQCPTPEQLVSFGSTVPKFDIIQISDDLEQAAAIKKEGNAGFTMEFAQAWDKAHNQYIQDGYLTARTIAQGTIPFPEIKKALIKLYGNEQANWKCQEYSKTWLTQHFAEDPFLQQPVEEIDVANEHEYVLARGTDASGDEVVNTTLTAINATDIKPEQLSWLWPDRIPAGTICWFTGKPGIGKSLATLDVVARLTTGKDWPDGEQNLLPPQDVLLAIAEDSLSTVVVPRLNAAGADLTRVKFFNRVKLDDGGRELQLSSDLTLLRRALEASPSVSLVILDPLESFFGDVNINVNQEIRPITNGLKRIFEKTKVTLIGIVHDNKRTDVSAIQKIPGGSAVSGAARGALGFSRDPENQNEFYMSMVKGSFTKKQTGLKYTIGEKEVDGIKAPHIVWGEEHDNTADDLLNNERDTGGRKENKQIDKARTFIDGFLSAGKTRNSKDLYREAEEQGISSDTMKRARTLFYPMIRIDQRDNRGFMWTHPDRAKEENFIPEDAV